MYMVLKHWTLYLHFLDLQIWSLQSTKTLLHVVVQLLNLFATPWTAACPASLSIMNSQSLLRLMSVELVMPSNHLNLCCPLLLPSIFPSLRVFTSESVLRIKCPNIGSSTSVFALPVNIQKWIPLGLIGLILLLSKGLSRVFSNPTILQCSTFFMV